MSCFDRMYRFFDSETMFISAVMLAVFVVPNNGSPLFVGTTPWEMIFSRISMAICSCILVSLLGLNKFIPFLTIVLLIASIIFFPARIQDIAMMYRSTCSMDLKP